MDFNNLNKDAKKFIESIVDNYVLGKKYMSDGSNPYIIDPGIQVQNIFMEFTDTTGYNVSLHKTEDSNVEVHYVYSPELITPNVDEDKSNAEGRLLKIWKAEIIYKICLLKWLLDAGYIFLIDDKDWTLFHTGKITERDYDRWTENKMLFHREIIKSEVIFDFISQFHNCTIIPSPQLIDLRNQNFKTPEQIRFEKQQKIANDSLKEARKATILAQKSQKCTIWTSVIICIITLIVSCVIAFFIPMGVSTDFSNPLNTRLNSIESTNSLILHNNSEILKVISQRDSINRIIIEQYKNGKTNYEKP